MTLVLIHRQAHLHTIHIPPDTTQTPPDNIQTPPDKPFLPIRGHWKKRQYLNIVTYYNFHKYYNILPMDWVLIHPQTLLHHSDTSRHNQGTSRHHPDTPIHYPDIVDFMLYRAMEEKAKSVYHDLL